MSTTPTNQLWMGDLDASWNEAVIMDLWTRAGENPASVKVMKDKNGIPLYCFVNFNTPEEVANAIQKNRTPIPGTLRSFKLNWASNGGPPQGNAPFRQNRQQVTELSAFVGDLSQEVTEPQLFALFDKENPGSVTQVKIMTDPATRRSKGFGFVRFNNANAHAQALKTMSGKILGGKMIRVSASNAKSDGPDQNAKRTPDPRTAVASIKLAQYHPPLNPATDPNNSVIAVRGITPVITRDELLAHFLPFGHIIYCRLDYKKKIARIKFLHRVNAQMAMHHMYGFLINECPISLRWGREETTEDGEVRFFPTDKSTKYVASEKEPKITLQLLQNVVFEDLTAEQVKNLRVDEASDLLSFEEMNKQQELKRQQRDEYLNLAF